MEIRHFLIFDIIWDATPNELNYLPQSIKVAISDSNVNDLYDQNDIEYFLENFISDYNVYCHYGFQYDELN